MTEGGLMTTYQSRGLMLNDKEEGVKGSPISGMFDSTIVNIIIFLQLIEKNGNSLGKIFWGG
jgi:hypothetical protein